MVIHSNFIKHFLTTIRLFCLIIIVINISNISACAFDLKSLKTNNPQIEVISRNKTTIPRFCSTLTTLQNGNILISGNRFGKTDYGKLIEIYDIQTNKISPAGNLQITGEDQSAILLRDGRVLIVGGTSYGFDFDARYYAQIYNPETQITDIISDNKYYFGSNAKMFLLNDNKVIIVSAGFYEKKLNYYYIFDAETNSFQKFPTPDNFQLNNILKSDNDKIIIAGYKLIENNSRQNFVYATFEYNAIKNQFIELTSINTADSGIEYYILNNEKLLCFLNIFSKKEPAKIAILNLKTNELNTIGNTILPYYHYSLRISDDKILLYGTTKIEIYDLKTNQSYIVSNILNSYSRGALGSTILLKNKNILTIGGYSPWQGYSDYAVLYKLKI